MPRRKSMGVDAETAWHNTFEELCAYKEEYGHCLVPSSYEDNPKLGSWVKRQRFLYSGLNKGKKNTLSPERIKKLENIGFVWRVDPTQVGLAWRVQQEHGTWQRTFHQLKRYKNAHGHCFVIEDQSVEKELIDWVAEQRREYQLFRDEKDNKKRSSTVSKLTNERAGMLDHLGFEWEGKYLELQDYYKKTGNSLIPHKYKENQSLADWARMQRLEYRQMSEGRPSALTELRVALLEKLEFHFQSETVIDAQMNEAPNGTRITTKKKDDQWDDRLEELRDYRDKNGHCMVPCRFKDNPKLGVWVKTQRYQYQEMIKGRKSAMTDYRRRALEDMGFVWCVQPKGSWKKRFGELKEYKEKHGDTLVPKDYRPNMALGAWVSNQRYQYTLYKKELGNRSMEDEEEDQDNANASESGDLNKKKKYKSTLTDERVNALDEIGFVWCWKSHNEERVNATKAPAKPMVTVSPPMDISELFWRAKFDELRKFKEKFGHCLVPIRYKENPKLGAWAKTQRVQYRSFLLGKQNSALTPERVAMLENIGFVWNVQEADNWYRKYEELQEYKKQHGDCMVPRSYSPDKQLANWVSTQRYNFQMLSRGKKSPLTKERVALLNVIGFNWNLNDDDINDEFWEEEEREMESLPAEDESGTNIKDEEDSCLKIDLI